MKENNNLNYGLETVLNRIRLDDYVPFDYHLKECLSDFKVEASLSPKFIAPVLSVVNEYSPCNIKEASIILIEAVGASGKSELTKKMSHWLKCPIFDLGQTKVVGMNSLTGLLPKRMDRKESFEFMDNISRGRSTLIIDALDEGYMKTNNQGYLDFLDDVLSLNPQKSCPIVMLGRFNAVELAANFFFDKKIDFVTLQIEPFTLAQATEFIDKAVESLAKLRYETIYKDTRDYILKTIDGFFKDQSSIKNHASERFIGYAPVLQSIAAFFDEHTNYRVVLDEMKEKNVKSVQLIVDIIERILKRDRVEKVQPILLRGMLADRDSDFRKKVLDQVYDFDEQCARVLYKVLELAFPEMDINDASFLTEYNEHMKNWVNEHPFLGKKRVANIVFESYILARLTRISKYQEAAYQYIEKFGISYMFALIYYALYGFKDVDARILPYVYESLSELNNKAAYYTLNMESMDYKEGDKVVSCHFEFEGNVDSLPPYKGNVEYDIKAKLDLGKRLEYLNIDVPLDFSLKYRNIEAVAPSYIKCRNLHIESSELTLYNQVGESNFMFEADDVIVSQKYEQYLKIGGPGKSSQALIIISPNQLQYPLIDYWTSADVKLKELTAKEISLYKKLRSIILEFRSHSKHVLAKYHEKIDFIYGNNETGKLVINALLNKKIMYKEGHLYKLDSDLMAKELGLSYDDIRHFDMSDQVKAFLRNINNI